MKHISLHGICRCEPRRNLQRGEPEAKQSQPAINTYIHKLTLSTFASLSICLFFAPALAWTGPLRSLQACSFTPLGSYDTPDMAISVFVSGSTAYVTDYWDGLYIVDVSNPEAPALLGSYGTPDNTWGVYVSGNRAYVADGYSGLHIIDVSNPEAPALLGSYDTPGWAYVGYVSGNRAYMVDCWGGFHIIDVSNPEVPALLGSYDTPDFAVHVYVSGNRAYVADGYSGLHIIDVSNPEAPALLGSYNTPDFAESIYVSGSRAYVADGNSGLHIIDVSNPEVPALLGSYDTPGFAGSIYVSGSRVYVADGNSGLHIIDVSCECQCPADSSGGCVSGQVTNKKTGKPLAGKVVRLKRRFPKKPKVKMMLRTTDCDGCYSFTGLEDGKYKVKAKRYIRLRCRGGRKKIVVINGEAKVNDVNFECKKKRRRRR